MFCISISDSNASNFNPAQEIVSGTCKDKAELEADIHSKWEA